MRPPSPGAMKQRPPSPQPTSAKPPPIQKPLLTPTGPPTLRKRDPKPKDHQGSPTPVQALAPQSSDASKTKEKDGDSNIDMNLDQTEAESNIKQPAVASFNSTNIYQTPECLQQSLQISFGVRSDELKLDTGSRIFVLVLLIKDNFHKGNNYFNNLKSTQINLGTLELVYIFK